MAYTQLLFIHVYFGCNAYLFGNYNGRGLNTGTPIEECIAAVVLLLFGVPLVGGVMAYGTIKGILSKPKHPNNN
jgi:hypothetical protein